MELNDLPHAEAQVLELLSEGLTMKAIAERLGRTVSTVDNQKRTLFLRLGVDNRVAAARWLWEKQGKAA